MTKKVKCRLDCPDAEGENESVVEAFTVPSCDNLLVVHPSIGVAGKQGYWAITHVPSGAAAGEHWRSKKHAMEGAGMLLDYLSRHPRKRKQASGCSEASQRAWPKSFLEAVHEFMLFPDRRPKPQKTKPQRPGSGTAGRGRRGRARTRAGGK